MQNENQYVGWGFTTKLTFFNICWSCFLSIFLIPFVFCILLACFAPSNLSLYHLNCCYTFFFFQDHYHDFSLSVRHVFFQSSNFLLLSEFSLLFSLLPLFKRIQVTSPCYWLFFRNILELVFYDSPDQVVFPLLLAFCILLLVSLLPFLQRIHITLVGRYFVFLPRSKKVEDLLPSANHAISQSFPFLLLSIFPFCLFRFFHYFNVSKSPQLLLGFFFLGISFSWLSTFSQSCYLSIFSLPLIF